MRGRADGPVTLEHAEDALQRKALLYDKRADQHYDYDLGLDQGHARLGPDASLYYLAVMLEGGEDPRFIARRMVILASEDVGNADPQALQIAVAAAQAVEHVGMPEGQFTLAQAAIYLSLAPKSDAAKRADRRGPRARARARRRAAAVLPALGRLPRRGALGRVWATTTRTTTPGVSPQELAARRRRGGASTRPTRPRRSWPSAWPKCGGRAAASACAAGCRTL